VHTRHARTAPQVHAPANTTPRAHSLTKLRVLVPVLARAISFSRFSAPHNGLRFSRREASAASEAVGWKRLLCRLSLKVVPSNAGNVVVPRNGGRIETTFQTRAALPLPSCVCLPLVRAGSVILTAVP